MAELRIKQLRKEKERQERAMQRLQELYLYSESAMLEEDFIIRKSEILKRLGDVSSKLGLISRGSESSLSDEDFIKQASHLLISRQLSGREYIYRYLRKS